ncbi:MAG: hypothetical protein J5634_04735 [Bacilli bacterium]|nr:hypothetical protein [Bacilli bacterium]
MKNNKMISEFKFFELFLSSYILNGNVPIIIRDEIEHKLAKYKDNEKYAFLYNDVIRYKANIDPEMPVILSESFQRGLAFGLVTVIQDGSIHTKYIINMDDKEAKGILKECDAEEINAMNEIVADAFNKNSLGNSKKRVRI